MVHNNADTYMYNVGAIILPRNSYRYTRTYYISELNCTGDERTVQNCSYTAPKKGNCLNAPLICQS